MCLSFDIHTKIVQNASQCTAKEFAGVIKVVTQVEDYLMEDNVMGLLIQGREKQNELQHNFSWLEEKDQGQQKRHY